MKKIFALIILAVISKGLSAQIDFIKQPGEKPFRAEIKKVSDSTILYQSAIGRVEFTIPTRLIDFIEYGGQRIVYYKYKPAEHDINTPELQKLSKEDPLSLIKQGSKVFIPITSTSIERNYLGNIFMREFLPDYSLWEVVPSEQEAQFILNYFYDENGRDKIYFTLKTRDNKVFYSSGIFPAQATWTRAAEARDCVKYLLEHEIPRIKKRIGFE
jgi:hypothetical protein